MTKVISIFVDNSNKFGRNGTGGRLVDSVAGADGCIYGIPYSGRTLKFNPVDNSITPIGPDLGNVRWKWRGGALAGNGCIYCAPWHSNEILKIDTIDGTVSKLRSKLPEQGVCKWSSGALALDGCLYFMPFKARRILKVDPRDDSVTSVGADFDYYCGGTVVGKDGCIYGIPHQSDLIVKFDTVTQILSFVGEKYGSAFKCGIGGISSRDGSMIYAATQNGQVLKIDVDDSSYSVLKGTGTDTKIDIRVRDGTDYSPGQGWGGAALGHDECVYWVPYNSNHVLKYDPNTDLVSLVEVNGFVDLSGFDRRPDPSPCKWFGSGVLSIGGAIYCMPFNASHVLVIDTLEDSDDCTS